MTKKRVQPEVNLSPSATRSPTSPKPLAQKWIVRKTSGLSMQFLRRLSRVPSTSPRESPRTGSSVVSVLGLAAIVLLTGCHSIRVRFRAREGLDLSYANDFWKAAVKFEEA